MCRATGLRLRWSLSPWSRRSSNPQPRPNPRSRPHSNPDPDPDPNQVEAQLAALQRGPAGVEACWAYISPKNGNREGDQAALRFESVLTNNLFYEPLLGCSTWKVENT